MSGKAAKRRFTISPSQLRAMECRMQWFLGYHEGYRPRKSSDALELGKGLHAALDHFYSGGTNVVGFFHKWVDKRIKEIGSQWDDEVEAMEKARDLGAGMLEGYVEKYFHKDKFDVIATEKTLARRLPIPDKEGKFARCDVVVRLDGLVRCHETAKLFSLEHKSFSRFSLGDLETDQQFTAQVWVGQELAIQCGLDEPVVGVIYNGLRKQLPGPKVKLALFERHKVYRNEAQIATFLNRAYWQYRETQLKSWPIFPQPSPMRCPRCDFNAPCTEMQRGGDYAFLLREQYTKRGQLPFPLAKDVEESDD